VLLARPRFVALDEATSALDLENEDRMYQLMIDHNITLVSISHRPTTLKFHQLVLELTGTDTWKLHPAEEFHFGDEDAEVPVAKT
jgi:putative ATP-binding cassette transporter